MARGSSEGRKSLTRAQDIFTNTRPLWHPPGARGIYGGAVIAQCLSAAQRTVPANFTVHSMHCYFVLAGDAGIPVLYHVEDVRSGKSYATRTVQARQRGKCIFTTTMSFAREDSGGKRTIGHAAPMPEGVLGARPAGEGGDEQEGEDGGNSPFKSRQMDILNREGAPHVKRTRQWIKAKGRISPDGGHQAHLSALAYMSDSYFIGTVSRIHNLWREGAPAGEEEKARLRERQRESGVADSPASASAGDEPEIGMMVSLDHSIYFHEPRRFRADQWMFTEMESPWAGDGRGVVSQKMFTADGTLVATCYQEVSGSFFFCQDETGGVSWCTDLRHREWYGSSRTRSPRASCSRMAMAGWTIDPRWCECWRLY